MGLRERKKDRQRAAILAGALDLARERGFDALRVQDLAARLEISEATFFNYFPSKAALVDAWAQDELANAFAGIESESRPLRAGIRVAVRRLATSMAHHLDLARASWSRARPLLAPAAGSSASTVAESLAAAFERARDADEVRRDVEPGELAELLLAAVAAALARALLSERVTGARALEEPILRAAELVLDGARKRHERVRMPARMGPVAPV